MKKQSSLISNLADKINENHDVEDFQRYLSEIDHLLLVDRLKFCNILFSPNVMNDKYSPVFTKILFSIEKLKHTNCQEYEAFKWSIWHHYKKLLIASSESNYIDMFYKIARISCLFPESNTYYQSILCEEFLRSISFKKWNHITPIMDEIETTLVADEKLPFSVLQVYFAPCITQISNEQAFFSVMYFIVNNFSVDHIHSVIKDIIINVGNNKYDTLDYCLAILMSLNENNPANLAQIDDLIKIAKSLNNK